MMTAVMVRPANGPAAVSAADRVEPLQVYVLPLARPVVVLSWRDSPDSSLTLPTGTTRRIDRPGLVVLDKPAERQTLSLITPDKTTQRSVGGK
jgi:hypothetical protein